MPSLMPRWPASGPPQSSRSSRSPYPPDEARGERKRTGTTRIMHEAEEDRIDQMVHDADMATYEGAQEQRRRRRVVVTGIGAVTPIGSGRRGLWEGVQRGVS